MIEAIFGSWGRFWQDAAVFALMCAGALFASAVAMWLIFREKSGRVK